MAKQFEGFIPFSFNFGEDSLDRQLFVKKHEGQSEIKPEDRTLYIVNVPQFFNKKCLKHLFSEYGLIERICIHMRPTSGEEVDQNSKSSLFCPLTSKLGCKVAYIVFKRPAALKKILKCSDVKELPKCHFHSNVGKNKWIQQYNDSFVDQKLLQEEIRTFLQEFDSKSEEEKKKERELGGPDDEGWITVSKFSKKPKIPRIESVNKKIVDKRNAAQSKLTLMKFYKNQLRDEKMEEILDLRKRFEKDKARIAMMRKSRKFKPF
ncbi:ribosomal RNA-processing protein 7 homolog A-like [Argiope bruennichi]|uniref:Ribosomal RNA-processing protein 7 like protein n=1 Tax=Argiope bruennichi TaxID=94029 RepID=A0A8T0EM18_ARGBR|nr:ribosomal RNA-processing protein 7 homolog A-like [Argiope bruennichi]KAF8776787.1 Ribosomal RNA-processing protein 7 like protein [Argiope bruennichi]